MSIQDAYSELDKNHVHWDRKDSSHIVVFTPGYKTANHQLIELFLLRAGLVMISETFDAISGKTVAIYKHD